MLRTLGIVEACYRTEQARNRACRRIGGKPMLEWVARRATDCQRLSGVIVLTTDAPENAFVSRVVPPDVPVFVARKPDPLGCFAAALEEYLAEAVVRIGVDSPFVDPALVDRLIIAAESRPDDDYVSFGSRDGRPAILSPMGVGVEWVRAAALFKAAQRATRAEDREAVAAFLYRRPEKFRVRLIPVPKAIDRDDVRLAVDMEEDWEHMLAIFEALGPEEVEWQRIAELLDHQPALRMRMAALNRAQARA